MKQIKTEIIINASKEKVWTILTDFENYKNWNPFIVNSGGKAVVGSKLTNTMKLDEKTQTFRPKVLKVDENKYFDWLGHLFFKGLFDGHHYFKIEELADNQVKLVQGENFSGILSGMILKSIGEKTMANFVKMNNALKELAEAN
ncbi:MAG: SRPBCC domain-containing protein [Chloroflexia bacterium]|nr:SRPBCC domain-containing protein [Chloroflexia bacterium]